MAMVRDGFGFTGLLLRGLSLSYHNLDMWLENMVYELW